MTWVGHPAESSATVPPDNREENKIIRDRKHEGVAPEVHQLRSL